MFKFDLSMQSRHELNRQAEKQKAFLDGDIKFKAARLIEASRLVTKAFGPLIHDQNYGGTYDETYILRVIPALAHRMDPSIELLPEEKPKGTTYDPVVDRSDEALAIYIAQCMSWNTYQPKLHLALEMTGDPFIRQNDEFEELIDAVHFLTTDVRNGNFAAQAMMAHNLEAAQRGVKQLPGKFDGWSTKINENWLKAADRVLPNFILCSGNPVYRNYIGEFETEEQIEAAASRIIELISSGAERPEEEDEIKAMAEEIGISQRNLESAVGWDDHRRLVGHDRYLIKESAEESGYHAISFKQILEPEADLDSSLSL